MEKITSFTIDHIKLQPGLYVSRKDKVGSETVPTFDLLFPFNSSIYIRGHFIIDKLINLSQIGITLTANGAMHPHSSVCGLMFAHPAARYFAVGKISDEQFRDYARRRGIAPEKIKKFLTKNI